MERVREPRQPLAITRRYFRKYTIQVRALGAWLYTHLASNEEHGKLMYNDILRVNSMRTTQGCLNCASVSHYFLNCTNRSLWSRLGRNDIGTREHPEVMTGIRCGKYSCSEWDSDCKQIRPISSNVSLSYLGYFLTGPSGSYSGFQGCFEGSSDSLTGILYYQLVKTPVRTWLVISVAFEK